MPRPSAGVVAILAAAAATLLATSMDRGSTAAQIAAAAAVAALMLAVVPLAARERLGFETYAVASAAAGAAAIHFAVIVEHFEEWWGVGLFFVLSAVAQLAWAIAIVGSRSSRLICSGVIGNAAIVALWIVTRTGGTLVGPEADTPEPIGVADSVATALEIVIVVAGTRLAASRGTERGLPLGLAWVVGGVTLALTSVGLLSVLDVIS